MGWSESSRQEEWEEEGAMYRCKRKAHDANLRSRTRHEDTEDNVAGEIERQFSSVRRRRRLGCRLGPRDDHKVSE